MTAPEQEKEAPARSAPRKRSRSPFYGYLLLLVTGFALILLGDTLGFWLFLMLMGAALSYLGDQLGSYTGKQRLSVLGLRPKYTANVINLLTGLAITAMTLFGAGYMSENVQIALFRVRELREQAASLDAARRELQADIENVQGELDGLGAKYQETLTLNEALDEERQSLVAEKGLLETANAALATRFEDLGRANRKLEKDLDDLEDRREALDASIEEKLHEIRRLNRALEKKETAPVVIPRGQILLEETVAIPFDVTTEALEVLLADAAEQVRVRVELLDVRFGEESTRRLAAQGVEVVRQRLDEIRRFFDAREGESARLPKDCHVSLVSARNVSVGERLTRISFEVKANVLVFAAGDEVARTMVDGTLPEPKVLDQLLYFDTQVHTVLRERGVSASSLRRLRATQDPERLLNLVAVARETHAAGKIIPVRCVIGADVHAFGEPSIRFEALVPVAEGDLGSAIPAPVPVPANSPGVLDVEPPVGEAGEGLVLVLPEPKLSPGSLLDGRPLAVRGPDDVAGPPGKPGS